MVGWCHLPSCHADGCCVTAGLAPPGTANDHLRAHSWGHLGPTLAQQCQVAWLIVVTEGVYSMENHVYDDWHLVSQEAL